MADIHRDDRLKDSVAIVTGAGSRSEGIGNGRATAVVLARHGARVTLVDTVAEWAQETAAARARCSATEGTGLGYRLWRAVPGQRRVPLDHRHHAADRWRRDGGTPCISGAAECVKRLPLGAGTRH